MSVLGSYFRFDVPADTPVTDDFLLVRHRGDDGEVTTEPEKVDYSSIQQQNGTADLWKLDTLLAAGITPSKLNVHTSSTTRSADYDLIDKMMEDLPPVESKEISKN